MPKTPKVLIFDSGVGGLSVFKEVKALLPNLDYIYLFDNKAYPYGELKPDVLLYRVELLIQNMVQTQGVDLVVIACNTASTIVLPRLRQILSIPVVGVVPAIKPASLLSNKAVGLIATPATVKREYTRHLIYNFSPDKPVELLGSTRLVNIAEEKLCGKPVDIGELKQILSPLAEKVDVAVLGCTHFPLIKDEISAAFDDKIMLVDSGAAIARRVKSLISEATERKANKRYNIYCSAALGSKATLNRYTTELGFDPIEMLLFPDV
ncbi:glutamate racemase [Vibrio sp. HA2012]|uniref:glutamate racemase n=1 Tax=Vibrio sp. HA2012 TaxID=1971595 RepID=UPI000C2B6E7D|nr:glutamate racemase [Vibrio sp. HA2012]PJC85007.1 glutamate racemase [Vibrio sp. HA2012]